ncbi:hypothetical protein LINPERPRIM_LOCUS30796 [Linum perenne]
MIMRRWARGIKPVVIPEGQSPEWITFKRVPPAAISIEGISWMSSLIGKPVRKFVRDGLDVKVCIIRDKAVPCPESVMLLDEEEEHVIPVALAKARDYNVRRFEKQIYVPKKVLKVVLPESNDEVKVDEKVEEPITTPEKEVNHSSPEPDKQGESSKEPGEGSSGKKARKRRKKAKKKLEVTVSEEKVVEETNSVDAEKGSEAGKETVSLLTGSVPEKDSVQEIVTQDEGSKTSRLNLLPEDLQLRNGEISSKWSSEDEPEIIRTVRKATLDDFMQHVKHVKKKNQVSGVKTRYKASNR